MIRKPVVADTFYPGGAERLEQQVRAFMTDMSKQERAVAIMVPHAGYVYSGQVAGQVYSQVKIPRDVIIIGPNHRGMGATHAIMSSGSWNMPLGRIEINEPLAQAVMKHSLTLRDDASAHRYEHSLEVQAPFLQVLRPDFQLVPIVLSASSYDECKELGKAIADGIRDYGQDVLMVASTDMTHYEPHSEAQKKDRFAIERILELDPKGLMTTVLGRGISMCGVMPVTVVLEAALELGARSARLVAYSTSGETSGDYEQVVGYAGMIIS